MRQISMLKPSSTPNARISSAADQLAAAILSTCMALLKTTEERQDSSNALIGEFVMKRFFRKMFPLAGLSNMAFCQKRQSKKLRYRGRLSTDPQGSTLLPN